MSTRAPVALPRAVPPRSRMRRPAGSERTKIMRLKWSDCPRPRNGVTDHHSPEATAQPVSSCGVIAPVCSPFK